MPNRLIFANQFRGLAALLVIVSHYLGVYFGMRPVVAAATLSLPFPLATPAWVQAVNVPGLYYGPLGVSLFFLISGLVVPISLHRLRPEVFLLARLFRILPTYWCCLAIGLTAAWLSGHYWQQSQSLSPVWMLGNALLLHNYLGQPSLDLVNWTLAIELKFYLLVALTLPWLLRPGLGYALTASALVILLNVVTTFGPSGMVTPALPALATESVYLLFMLIGVGFYQHLVGGLSTAKLVLRSLTLLGGFAAAWACSAQREWFPLVPGQYALSLLLFSLGYALRYHFRPLRLLDYLADISYPLYAVHAVFGYATLQALIHAGWPFEAALSLTLSLVIGLATLIHHLIELPSTRLGKRLAAGWQARWDAVGAERP